MTGMKVSTPNDLRAIRETLGWSTVVMGRALGFSGDSMNVRRRVDRLETGELELTGPVRHLLEALEAGFRPDGFDPADPAHVERRERAA